MGNCPDRIQALCLLHIVVNAVAAVKLVAAVSGERHGDSSSRQHRNQHGRDLAAVGEGLVKILRDALDQLEHLLFADDLLRVFRAQMLRDCAGIAGFIISFIRKAD